MKLNRLYDEFAYLYPLISGPEAYADEAQLWKNVLCEKLGPGRHTMIEMGVGGGFNLSHFIQDFDATGSDLSEKMVNVSQKFNPGIPHVVGDMRTMRIGKQFKAVLIHDAICYMLTEDDLRQTFVTAHEHLEPGGFLLTAPDYFKETFTDGMVRHNTMSDGTTTLTHLEYEYDLDPNDTVNEMLIHYLIRKDGKLRVERDLHVLGLFSVETWHRLLTETGFDVEQRQHSLYNDGRVGWLLIAQKK
ncbi:MAG: class I SAM-dependent methyltransferase [candidate division Zixibacteria bacterium]|nr:class I SAM-dependent methyltransferase [candidate division Zixibacteria bacterium]